MAREAYSHEVSSAGFWPGGGAIEHPAFYSYAYPAPPGFADARVAPPAAPYSAALGEFVLPYDAVRAAAAPDKALLAFLQSTYAAAADLGAWPRAALEREIVPPPRGQPAVPRAPPGRLGQRATSQRVATRSDHAARNTVSDAGGAAARGPRLR